MQKGYHVFLSSCQRLSERLQILTFVLFCLVLFLILTRKMRENADTDIRCVREYFAVFLSKRRYIIKTIFKNQFLNIFKKSHFFQNDLK